MQLEHVAAKLRPRGAWESVDLGLALLRSRRSVVGAAWLTSVVPVMAITLIVLRDHAALAVFALWWLRPMFERVPLWVLSRALFGAAPNAAEFLAELPRLWTQSPGRGLFLHRLHIARSLVQPVTVLERAERASTARRESALMRDSGVVVITALLCLVFELVLTVSMSALIYYFTPTEFLPDFSRFTDVGPLEFDYGWFVWVVAASWIFAYSITGPVNAAAGFALYINRRMQLEGWDVDLAFQRIAARIERALKAASTAATLLVLACVAAMCAPCASAQERDPGVVAREVVANPDFGGEITEMSWSFEAEDADLPSPPADFALLADIVKVVMWTIGGLLIVAVIVLIARYAGWMRSRSKADVAADAQSPTHQLGLDLRPESLPSDIAAGARELWRRGEAAAALGLLYRAAISRLIERDGLAVESSDTERDCLRRVRALADTSRSAYFADVTGAWQICAYSTSRPSDEHVEALCVGWNAVFDRSVA